MIIKFTDYICIILPVQLTISILLIYCKITIQIVQQPTRIRSLFMNDVKLLSLAIIKKCKNHRKHINIAIKVLVHFQSITCPVVLK